ncbi:hypothetical protein [Paracidovorax valerianellae]|nr:hypothetical protein [Paracidovorax valerianellae]MDA8443621.1 hypothetical protein [Paracidovorax valerianellae]
MTILPGVACRVIQKSITTTKGKIREELNSIADLLNNRPRATLDWRSPIQPMRELVQGMDEQRDAAIH